MKANMKKIISAALLLVFAVICVASASETTETRVVVTSPFTAAVQAVRSSVVGVNNYQVVRYSNGGSSIYDYFGFGWGMPYGYGRDNEKRYTEEEVLKGTGSGTVIAEEYVLTNYHVVESAKRVTISIYSDLADKPEEMAATVVAYDENVDVAVLYVPGLQLKPVVMGDSDTLLEGDWAIVIGNPISAEQFYGTVTVGVVSGLNRTRTTYTYDKYGRRESIVNSMIQVDAAINNGNSGGGMFNTSGELMGIPFLKYSGSTSSGASIDNLGMCVPINAAKPVVDEAVAGHLTASAMEGTAEASAAEADKTDTTMIGKPRLGVTISEINENSTAVREGILPKGLYVSAIDENSPAQQAGIQVGDIIVDCDDTVITSTTQLQTILREHAAGDVLHIIVYRVPGLAELEDGAEIPDGEYVEFDVTLAVIDNNEQAS